MDIIVSGTPNCLGGTAEGDVGGRFASRADSRSDGACVRLLPSGECIAMAGDAGSVGLSDCEGLLICSTSFFAFTSSVCRFISFM